MSSVVARSESLARTRNVGDGTKPSELSDGLVAQRPQVSSKYLRRMKMNLSKINISSLSVSGNFNGTYGPGHYSCDTVIPTKSHYSAHSALYSIAKADQCASSGYWTHPVCPRFRPEDHDSRVNFSQEQIDLAKSLWQKSKISDMEGNLNALQQIFSLGTTPEDRMRDGVEALSEAFQALGEGIATYKAEMASVAEAFRCIGEICYKADLHAKEISAEKAKGRTGGRARRRLARLQSSISSWTVPSRTLLKSVAVAVASTTVAFSTLAA